MLFYVATVLELHTQDIHGYMAFAVVSASFAGEAPMGLAAIYCHPLEFFVSDLMSRSQHGRLQALETVRPFR